MAFPSVRLITNKFPRITGFELQEQVIKNPSASYKCAFMRINFRMKSTIRKSLITLHGEQRLLIQINVGIADISRIFSHKKKIIIAFYY